MVNQNDFDKALKRIDNETSDYYVVGYYSSNPDPTKRNRKLEVKTTRDRVNVWSRAHCCVRRLSPRNSRRLPDRVRGRGTRAPPAFSRPPRPDTPRPFRFPRSHAEAGTRDGRVAQPKERIRRFPDTPEAMQAKAASGSRTGTWPDADGLRPDPE